MVGVLPQRTVAVFELSGIELIENILVQIALMIVAEQVKHVGGGTSAVGQAQWGWI